MTRGEVILASVRLQSLRVLRETLLTSPLATTVVALGRLGGANARGQADDPRSSDDHLGLRVAIDCVRRD